MEATNYSSAIAGITFNYSCEAAAAFPQIGFLRTLLGDNDPLDFVDSTIECSFTAAQKKISEFFSYQTDDRGGVQELPNSNEHQRRLQTYWRILENHLSFPPSRCFEFQLSQSTDIGTLMEWSRAFIFIDEANKRGLYTELATLC